MQSLDELKVRLLSIIRQAGRWTCKRLISQLNGIITGWGCYHAYLCSIDEFSKMDEWINSRLWDWALPRHPTHTRKWIYHHYWHVVDDRRVFSSGDNRLLRFADVSVRVSASLDLMQNPYVDVEYFRNRRKERYCYEK